MIRRACAWCVLVLIGLVLVGCGAVSREARFGATYSPERGALVEVGKVTNATGRTPSVDNQPVDIEGLLTGKLTEKLSEKRLLWTGTPDRRLILNTNIVEYEPGDAFKRWLMPGWGSTVMVVACELRDETDTVIGTLRVRRTVDAGGAYTIGVWRSIFSKVAGDIVSELQSKIPR